MTVTEVGDFRQFTVAPSDGNNDRLDDGDRRFWKSLRERERQEIRRRLRRYRGWAIAAARARAARDAELMRREAREQEGGAQHG